MSETNRFRRLHFPGVSAREWNDWKWQLRNRLDTPQRLSRILELTAPERDALTRPRSTLPLAITPYYASLIDPHDSTDPLRRTMIPTVSELTRTDGECDDPLGEDAHSPVEGIVHTYPDKVLFLATDFCATYCRYCTRSRVVGGGELPPTESRWETGLRYIEQHAEIRDVLISGGDPLTLADSKLDWLLSRLRAIPHVQIIRMGTKIPAVLPQRITPTLAKILSRCKPFWLSVHFTHPHELTREAETACARLVDAGIPLMNQTVLLTGVNATIATMRELNQGLLRFRVKPYYLHQCDAVTGTSHFRTTIETGLRIIDGLHGHTTGYAVPMYMLDAPGGGGKIPLSPDYIVSRESGTVTVCNREGKHYTYHEGTAQMGDG